MVGMALLKYPFRRDGIALHGAHRYPFRPHFKFMAIRAR